MIRVMLSKRLNLNCFLGITCNVDNLGFRGFEDNRQLESGTLVERGRLVRVDAKVDYQKRMNQL